MYFNNLLKTRYLQNWLKVSNLLTLENFDNLMYHFGNEILGETETKTLSELGFKTNSELVVRLKLKGG